MVCVTVPVLLLWGIDRLDLSIYAAFGAFASLYGRFDTARRRVGMQLQAGLVQLLVMLLGTVASLWSAPVPARVILVAGIGGAVTLIAAQRGWHPPGALFAVFAAGATASIPADRWSVLHVLLVGGATVLFTVTVTVVLALLRRARFGAGVVTRRVVDRDQLEEAATVLLGCLVAGLVTMPISPAHWYWAMVATVAALGGRGLSARITRGLHRLAGTVLGLLVAAVLLASDLPAWVLILAVALCQVGAELFVGRNYGIAMIFVTPLALVMISLAAPVSPFELLTARLLDTVIGVVIGTAAAVLLAGIRRRRRPRTTG